MSLTEQRDHIIVELEKLNKKVARQNSIAFIFLTGIIYGVGFVVGSAILASILFGIFAPYVSEIDWVRDTFERGASMMNN